MPRVCETCGKGTIVGNSVPRKGLAKKRGGAGQHVVKRVRRNFRPNLLRLTCRYEGRIQSLRICVRCLKSGKVEKVF